MDIDVTLGDNRLNENVVNHYNALDQLTQTLMKNYKVSFTYDAEGCVRVRQGIVLGKVKSKFGGELKIKSGEVYDFNRRHLGSMDPTTGELYKPL